MTSEKMNIDIGIYGWFIVPAFHPRPTRNPRKNIEAVLYLRQSASSAGGNTSPSGIFTYGKKTQNYYDRMQSSSWNMNRPVSGNW
jgi:hypothetical protein